MPAVGKLGCDSDWGGWDSEGDGGGKEGSGGADMELLVVAAAAAAFRLGVDLAGRGDKRADRRLAAPVGKKEVRVGEAGVSGGFIDGAFADAAAAAFVDASLRRRAVSSSS